MIQINQQHIHKDKAKQEQSVRQDKLPHNRSENRSSWRTSISCSIDGSCGNVLIHKCVLMSIGWEMKTFKISESTTPSVVKILCFVGSSCLIDIICIDSRTLVSNAMSISDDNHWSHRNNIQTTCSNFQCTSNRRLCKTKGNTQPICSEREVIRFPSLVCLATFDVGLSLEFLLTVFVCWFVFPHFAYVWCWATL
jgi:hypothetical protein